MIVNNKNMISNLYRVNNAISKSSIVVVKSKIKSNKQKLVLLGKIYCQGFALIGIREEKGYTLFFIKKINPPKLVEDKVYTRFNTLLIHPYCEFLTPEIMAQIGPKILVNSKEKYTFLGRIWYMYKR